MSVKKDSLALTTLNEAIKSGDSELLMSLLHNGADLNAVDDEGMAPLNLICNQLELTPVHLTMMQQLIKFKADVNINKNRQEQSPIMHLFTDKKKGKLRFEALKLLLENNADPKQLDHEGDSVLHIILREKQYTYTIELIELLIKHGVDVNAKNCVGTIPLYLAINFPRTEVAECLLKYGANPNCIYYGNPRSLLCDICDKDYLKYTDLKMIQLLIQYKADVNLNAPILNLYRCKRYDDDVDLLLREDVLKLLLENNADPSVVEDNFGSIPTMILYRMHININLIKKIIKLLLKYRMDVNMKDKSGNTPLHVAANQGNAEMVTFLLQHGADPNIVDKYGNTPLNKICLKHHITNEYLLAVKCLLCSEVNVNIENNEKNTPLISLFDKRLEYQLCYEVLELLLKNNADITHKNNEGKTVLHVMIQYMDFRNHHYEYYIEEIYRCMKLIIQHGLDINVKDRNGLSPLDEAVLDWNLDLVRFLLENGSQVTAQFICDFFERKYDILPDLTRTQNILAIIDILENRGFPMQNDHFLSVLKFLIGYYVPMQSFKLKDALESGSSFVMKNYIEGHQLGKTELDIIYNYMCLAKYGMIYMDEKTFNDLLSSLKNLDSMVDYTLNNITIKKKIEKYIEEAKKVIIDKKTSLLDIFSSSPDTTYSLLKNFNYQSLVNSQHFKKTFGEISSILKGHINKSLVKGFGKKISQRLSRHLTIGDLYLISYF